MKKYLLAMLWLLWPLWLQAQTSYIIEQIGRDAHQIVQSLGAFVGNERAESQTFDITYMPPGNGVEGVLIINTADYRVTFKMDPMDGICFLILLDTRSAAFLDDFMRLFQSYPTEWDGATLRRMTFGDKRLQIEEKPSNSTRKRSFSIAPM